MKIKKHDYPMQKRTSLYVEGYSNEASMERVIDLRAAGFDAFSDSGAALMFELVRLAWTDIFVVFVDNASKTTWIKLGFALASGLKVVAIGKSDLVGIAALQVPTWHDLARNCFMKLGDTYMKKPAPVMKLKKPVR